MTKPKPKPKPHGMFIASLDDRKIVLSEAWPGRKTKKRRFDATDHVAIGEFIASLGFEPRLTCSSSCDFPDENGLDAAYDFNAVMSAAYQHARLKRAIRIPTPSLANALQAVEKACAGQPFPLTVIFAGSALVKNKRGELVDEMHGGITMTFNNENEYIMFVNGLGYGRALARHHGFSG